MASFRQRWHAVLGIKPGECMLRSTGAPRFTNPATGRGSAGHSFQGNHVAAASLCAVIGQDWGMSPMNEGVSAEGPIVPALPEGWEAERIDRSSDTVALRHPAGGFVSISFSRRIFDIGMAVPHRHAGKPRAYAGRTWKRHIVEDAVSHLRSILG